MEIKFEIEDELFTKDVENFVNIQKEMVKLYARKNHDYGNSFNKGMDDIGFTYGVGRLYDKMNRILNYLKTTFVVNGEGFEDTVIDLACYSTMLLSYIKYNMPAIEETVKPNPIDFFGSDFDIENYNTPNGKEEK